VYPHYPTVEACGFCFIGLHAVRSNEKEIKPARTMARILFCTLKDLKVINNPCTKMINASTSLELCIAVLRAFVTVILADVRYFS
jgi:hypothetical protein